MSLMSNPDSPAGGPRRAPIGIGVVGTDGEVRIQVAHSAPCSGCPGCWSLGFAQLIGFAPTLLIRMNSSSSCVPARPNTNTQALKVPGVEPNPCSCAVPLLVPEFAGHNQAPWHLASAVLIVGLPARFAGLHFGKDVRVELEVVIELELYPVGCGGPGEVRVRVDRELSRGEDAVRVARGEREAHGRAGRPQGGASHCQCPRHGQSENDGDLFLIRDEAFDALEPPVRRLGRRPRASASPLGLVGGSGDRRKGQPLTPSRLRQARRRGEVETTERVSLRPPGGGPRAQREIGLGDTS